MDNSYPHLSVLLHEAVTALAIKPDGIYIDATFGRGGHSRLILEQLGDSGRLFGIDRDPQAVAVAAGLAEQDRRFEIIHGDFSGLAGYMAARGLTGLVDGVLLDLGVSSPQLDDPARGFSFLRDGPLDMRMDPGRGESAAEWLAHADMDDIAWVLKTFGEERFAKRIARAIVDYRAEQTLTTTGQLAHLIAAVSPTREKHKHPATRSFQAIRIYINSELEEIELALEGALKVLAAGGRLVVISFHSLEDRLVKRFIRKQEQGVDAPPNLPLTVAQLARGRTLRAVGKAQKPSAAEIAANTRARSSVLRVAERLAEGLHG